ncbi:MAG: abortive infection protein [Sulfobacillus acidophilus]|uniref:Abortive infection protein n=1 Tax=Sulfobacillus acidophilus TaxID=53633 RepID=A0A2T2WG58_9FIRM|nr:MAG: abortive infection protein [Sulfobacillus acidophilus]
MRWQQRIRWPGISSSDPHFLRFVGLAPTWRLIVATVAASATVLIMGSVARSSTVGYGYGGVFFVIVSWPLVRPVLRSLQWTDATIWQTILLVIASLAMGAAAQKILGFNPQSGRLQHLPWSSGQHLLWQFPLVLPVENLVLLGGLVALWQLIRPRSGFERFMVGLVAAGVFGLWHVPVWGGWTLVVVSLTVFPWTVYLLATGDMLVPMLAHLAMDTLAVLSTAAPERAWFRVFVDPILLLSLLALGLMWSVYQEWRERHARRW